MNNPLVLILATLEDETEFVLVADPGFLLFKAVYLLEQNVYDLRMVKKDEADFSRFVKHQENKEGLPKDFEKKYGLFPSEINIQELVNQVGLAYRNHKKHG